MAEPGVLRRMLGFGLFGVAAMTVLAPGIALMRGTTGHDWYAAGKLTAVETARAVGFDRKAPVVEYRRWNGVVVRMSRDDMYWNGEALAARERILETALHYALLGAGIGGAVLLATMLGAAGRLPRRQRDETARPEPAYPYRTRAGPASASSPAGRLADRLRAGRGRVALLAVPEADLTEIAEPDGVVHLAQSARKDGAALDDGDSRRALPAAPPERPAAERGDAAAGPDPEGGRPHKYGRWA